MKIRQKRICLLLAGACMAATLTACKDESVMLPPVVTATPVVSFTPAPVHTDTPPPAATPDPDRPVIGLYIPQEGSGKRTLVSTFTGPWEQGKDIDCFEAIASEEPTLSGGSFRRIWQTQWARYPQADAYKVGFTLSFTLASGEEVRRTILSPADITEDFTRYVEVYLYDDVHQQAGVRYSHLLETEMNEQTVITSVKLTAGKEIAQVQAIELQAFVYRNGEFDADTGAYTGPGGYAVAIERS